MDTPSLEAIQSDLKKTFIQQVLGPRGGLFALGIFLGMFVMHVYMTKTVIANQNLAHSVQQELLLSQIESLKTRVAALEADKNELHKKLAEIAFDKMPESK